MNHNYKQLEWDSNFFGYKIAKLKGTFNSKKLKVCLHNLKQREFKLIYWEVNPLDIESNEAAVVNQGLLVDVKTFFSFSLVHDNEWVISENIYKYNNKSLDRNIIRLSIQAGEYSRYKIDKKISDNDFKRLYEQWAVNSVSNKITDNVYVYKEKDVIYGIITLKKKENIGIIGIIAVDAEYRGNNIGTNLIIASKKYFSDLKCDAINVVTQEQNTQACNFYIKNSFQIVKKLNFYHIWL